MLRRSFLRLFGVGAALLGLGRARAESSSRLQQLADAIAPGGAGLPSASEAGADRYLARALSSAPPEVARAIMAATSAEALRASAPEAFEWLRQRVYEGLYGRPGQSWRTLGFP